MGFFSRMEADSPHFFEDMIYTWSRPLRQPFLSGHAIHLWRAVLDVSEARIHKFEGILSPGEKTRAGHFAFEQDRNRFIAARGILRVMLGWYLGIEPETISFGYERNGKPVLENSLCNTGIQFNVSHSGDLALYVVTRNRRVGVDVEYVREIPEMEQITEQFFSPRERAFFNTLSEREKQQTFFTWWTRKEALIKARGDGLSSYGLDSPDVSLTSTGLPLSSIKLRDKNDESEWSVVDMKLANGFASAFAVEADHGDTLHRIRVLA